MKSSNCLGYLVGVLLCGAAAHADVTDTSPHDYDNRPKAGREGGTFAFQAAGGAGADCVTVVVGTAKVLPNAGRTGGTVCIKFNLESQGTGPLCALGPTVNPALWVLGGTYTLNGDGTACASTVVIEPSIVAGIPLTFHTYFDRKGRTMLFSAQDIAYACPGVPANGPAFTAGTGFKISRFGDEPPGSGVLPCP